MCNMKALSLVVKKVVAKVKVFVHASHADAEKKMCQLVHVLL